MRRNPLVAAVVAACLAVALAGVAHPADARTGSASRGNATTSALASSSGSKPGATHAGAYQSIVKSAAKDKTAGTNKASFTSGDCADGTDKPYATGLPPLPCAPNKLDKSNLYFDYGADFQDTVTNATKAKITITLPMLRVRAFNILCFNPQPPTYPPCPVNLHFPKLDSSVSPAGYYGTYAQAWVRSPKGVTPAFGVLPAVDVSMLAFGSIPVTATVHINQPVTNGVAAPQKLAYYQSATPVIPGTYIPGFKKYGPVPQTEPGKSGNFFTPPAELGGPVIIRVDNVKVDGVPLSVGSSCQTSTRLSLGAPGGFYVANSIPTRAEPGAWQPLRSVQSYLAGSVNIPPFAGCHNGNEDLDALLTGMVSGPNNAVNTTEVTGLTNYGCVVHPTDPDCNSLHPGAVKLAKAATRSSSSTFAKLEQYGTLTRDYAKYLPRSVRDSLPD